MIDFLIFSKNRPLQLHALLSSMSKYVKGSYTVAVLHKYDEMYVEALNELKQEFQTVRFIEESNFRDNVIDYLAEKDDSCSFLVDDIIFKQEFDTDQLSGIMSSNPSIVCFSLRLGLHLKHCYTRNLPQRIPDGQVKQDFFIWEWRGTDSDWGYPLSVDGHIFRRNEILAWSKSLSFQSPNQYEDALQLILRYDQTVPNHCVCFVRSKIFNVPANRVQNEINNRNEGFDVEKMLESWNNGDRIDFSNLYDISNESAHYAVDLNLINKSQTEITQ